MQEQLLTSLIQRLESFGLAILVLLVGWLVAKLLGKVVYKLLVALKVDNISQSLDKIDFIRNADVNFSVSKIISRLVYYVVLLIIIAVSAEILEITIISEQIESLINYLPKLLSGGLLFIGGLILANLVKEVITASFLSMGIASGSIISNFIFYFLVITVAISAMSQAEINTDFITSNLTIIIAGIVAAFAIGYGLASKNVMSNLLSSIYTKKKFHLGDVIRVRDIKGQIISIDNVSVTLQTESKQVIIPLNRLSDEEVELHGTWDTNKLID